jgi:hypothetical protein
MTGLPEIKFRPVRGYTPTPNVTYCCGSCGGKNVKRDAWARWNEELQMWELGEFFDHAHCDDCDGETKLKEVLL